MSRNQPGQNRSKEEYQQQVPEKHRGNTQKLHEWAKSENRPLKYYDCYEALAQYDYNLDVTKEAIRNDAYKPWKTNSQSKTKYTKKQQGNKRVTLHFNKQDDINIEDESPLPPQKPQQQKKEQKPKQAKKDDEINIIVEDKSASESQQKPKKENNKEQNKKQQKEEPKKEQKPQNVPEKVENKHDKQKKEDQHKHEDNKRTRKLNGNEDNEGNQQHHHFHSQYSVPEWQQYYQPPPPGYVYPPQPQYFYPQPPAMAPTAGQFGYFANGPNGPVFYPVPPSYYPYGAPMMQGQQPYPHPHDGKQ